MVEELRLWAINVDAFRQCFAAPADLAQELWGITERELEASKPRSGGWLSKLGPLMRNPPEGAVIRPGIPNRIDAEAMMTSRYIAAERRDACWVLARAWLNARARANATIPLPRSQIDEMEFDLARAEVPTQIGIRHLFQWGLEIPLRPGDNMSIGYLDQATVARLAEAWATALPELVPETVAFATAFLEFVEPFAQYASEAEEQGTPPIDLIAWWTAR